ncbi:hypothetical protein Ancab_009777 [Ancistrocladus abbreviatus]
MSTVDLELSNFINPNLTWKTVSKGRNTSRRSRRSVSKSLKMGQEQGNRSSKRVEAPQVLESEKQPRAVVTHRRLSDSIEHIPIKKRRFPLRSPSPPPQCPHCPKESEELPDGHCDSDWKISMGAVLEHGHVEINSANAREPSHYVSDGNLDGQTPTSTSEVQGCNEDFSGIAMLADAACSDSLKNAAADARSPADEFLEQEQNKYASMTSRNEPTYFELSDTSGKAHDGMDGSLTALSIDTSKAAEETKRSSGTSCDERFLWDLNVAMDEWDHPLHDTTVASGLNLVGDTTIDISHGKNYGDVEDYDAQKESGKIGSYDELTLQPSVCKHTAVEVQSELTDIVHAASVLNPKEGLSGLERSSLNHDFASAASSHALERSVLTLDSKVADSKVTRINHTLSLRTDDMKTWLSTDNQKRDAGSNCIQVVREDSAPAVRGGESEDSLVKLDALGKIESEPCEITCQHVEPHLFAVEKREIAFLHKSGSGNATFEANNAMCKDEEHRERTDLYDSENELGNFSCLPGEPHPPSVETIMSELEEVGFSHSLNKSIDTGAAAPGSEPSTETMEVKEKSDKTSVIDASRLDDQLVSGSEVLVQIGSLHLTAEEACDRQVHGPSNQSGKVPLGYGLDGNQDSHVSPGGRFIGDRTELEGGYDSHLEDGELREPVGIFWEENEGEEAEHVDYDSDNRDGYEATDAARNDSLPLPQKVLVGVNVERRSQSDQCGYEDDQPTSEKSTGGNSCHSCPGSLSTADTKYLRRKSSTSNTGLIAPFKGMDNSEGSEMGLKAGRKPVVGSDDFNKGETDASGNVSEAQTKVVGLTAPRRELQSQIERPESSDRKDVESVRRSRAGNLGYMYNGDGRQIDANESMDKGRTSLQLDGRDRLGNRPWSFSLKSAVGNSASGGDGERFFRASDDTSPGIRRSTMISTSKSGCAHLVRKGLPAERDDEYGMGKVKVQDISPDNALRSRLDRYPIGINRGYREGYRRQGIYETAIAPGTIRNYFGKRERSFSPIIDRMDHLSQGRGRSRSRSRSHSPDFRSEARTGRMRIPYPPASHAANHVRERRSPGRMFCQGQRFDTIGSPGRLRPDDCLRPMMRPVRFSDMASSGRNHQYEEGDDYKRKPHLPRSHRRSRSRSRSRSPEFRSEARVGTIRLPYQPRAATHIRDRRSPVRLFRPGQRFETLDSQGRVRSDDYLRPMMRPVRFPDAAQSGRGNDYDGDNFRRKPRKIFERIHPIRHYEMDGERRFQYEAEDVNGTQGFRTADRRSGDVLRNTREERGNTRYHSDRIYYSGPKQLGMRDYGDDTQPRTMRP